MITNRTEQAIKLKQVFIKCLDLLSQHCEEPPLEMDEKQKKQDHQHAQLGFHPKIGIRHLKWMCFRGCELIDEAFVDPKGVASKLEKANRWLGFVQGAIWTHGYTSIDVLKKWNTPTSTNM